MYSSESLANPDAKNEPISDNTAKDAVKTADKSSLPQPTADMDRVLDKATAPRPRVVHRRSLSNPIGRFPSPEAIIPQAQSTTHHTPASQVLEIPPTPELASNSIGDTPTTAHYEPPTPIYGDMSMVHQQSSEQKASDTSSSVEGDIDRSGRDHFRRQTIDTKAIFVGGLETVGPDAWDEPRLRSVFGKYGTILEVRLMIPSECMLDLPLIFAS